MDTKRKPSCEKIAEAQTFWNEFFNIFGIARKRIASFEEPVKKLGNQRSSIDLFWKGTLLVEHKSKGEDLEKAYGQADEVVDKCYRPQPFNSELERLEFLFNLYRKYTEPLNLMIEKKGKKKK